MTAAERRSLRSCWWRRFLSVVIRALNSRSAAFSNAPLSRCSIPSHERSIWCEQSMRGVAVQEFPDQKNFHALARRVPPTFTPRPSCVLRALERLPPEHESHGGIKRGNHQSEPRFRYSRIALSLARACL